MIVGRNALILVEDQSIGADESATVHIWMGIIVNDSGLSEAARQDIRAVLRERFSIETVMRVVDTDASEEVIVLRAKDFARIDPDDVALAVMDVLPHVKIWAIREHQAWETEPL